MKNLARDVTVFNITPAFQHHALHSLNKVKTQDPSEIDFNNYTVSSAVKNFNNRLSIKPYALDKSNDVLGGVMKKSEMKRSNSLSSIIRDESYNLPDNRTFLNDLSQSLLQRLDEQSQYASSDENLLDDFITPNLHGRRHSFSSVERPRLEERRSLSHEFRT